MMQIQLVLLITAMMSVIAMPADSTDDGPLQDVDVHNRRFWLQDGINEHVWNRICDTALPPVVQEYTLYEDRTGYKHEDHIETPSETYLRLVAMELTNTGVQWRTWHEESYALGLCAGKITIPGTPVQAAHMLGSVNDVEYSSSMLHGRPFSRVGLTKLKIGAGSLPWLVKDMEHYHQRFLRKYLETSLNGYDEHSYMYGYYAGMGYVADVKYEGAYTCSRLTVGDITTTYTTYRRY